MCSYQLLIIPYNPYNIFCIKYPSFFKCYKSYLEIYQFNIENTSIFKDIFNFTYYGLINNEIKIYKWKLLNNILSNKVLLTKWKIGHSNFNLCNVCKYNEDYNHYFIECIYSIMMAFGKTQFNKLGIQNDMRNFRHILLGYR